jgi:hypothetical protein
MPQYYFHLRTDRTLASDEEGCWLPDLEAARSEAIASAREILADAIKAGVANQMANAAIVIAELSGTEVAAVNLKDVLPRNLVS